MRWREPGIVLMNEVTKHSTTHTNMYETSLKVEKHRISKYYLNGIWWHLIQSIVIVHVDFSHSKATTQCFNCSSSCLNDKWYRVGDIPLSFNYALFIAFYWLRLVLWREIWHKYFNIALKSHVIQDTVQLITETVAVQDCKCKDNLLWSKC